MAPLSPKSPHMAIEAELIESPLVGMTNRLPAPHDPSERALLHAQYGWQIRTYPWNSSKHLLYKTKGMLNLQLWYPEIRLSVLTPSVLQEVSMKSGWAMRWCASGDHWKSPNCCMIGVEFGCLALE